MFFGFAFLFHVIKKKLKGPAIVGKDDFLSVSRREREDSRSSKEPPRSRHFRHAIPRFV